MIFYVISVLFMSNMGAMVDLVLHPEISYFDKEHWIVGGITCLAMILFVITLEAYLARHEQIEGTLRESENRYRTLFENSTDSLMILEAPSWACTSGNRAAVEMFGTKSVEEFTSHAPGDLSPERQPDGRASAEKWKEMIEKAIQEGSLLFEWTHKRINGDEFPTTVLLTRVEIAGKRFLQVTERDNTERKRSEEHVARLLLKNELILCSAAEGILGLDLQGRHTFVNPAAARMLGYEADELLGRPSHSIWHHTKPDGSPFPEEECPIYATHRDGMVHRVSTEVFWSKVGTSFPVEYSSTPIIEQDQLAGAVVAFVDITERKRAEEEKHSLERQVQQAQKMEAVGRLAGGVAHDFNNLLTVITGYSELLLQKIGEESPMHGEVEQIQRAGERAASLTQHLLAFSRKQIIEPKVLDLNLLMANVGKMLIRLIGENIDLKTVHGKNLGLVKIDSGQFDQVLINLAVNARDAMPDGGTLLIETANVELDEEYCAGRPYQIRPGRFVRLSVSDTGHGMTKEVTQQIYEPFFTTKEQGKGTGLGLSMIFGAVKQSGGSIEVYSEVGKGTTFKIYLPRVEEEAVTPGKDGQSAVLPIGTETLLVVEDEETLRKLAIRILGGLGYKVLQAGSGDEAISLAVEYKERIDLLLTDVVMPGMNGAELARQLVLHRPEMKVLFTSGYTDDAITRHGVLDKGVSFIGKPYTLSALTKKVREVLDKA